MINSSQTPIVSYNNTSFSHISNTFQDTITPKSRNLDAEKSRLIKEGKCFNYKRKGYTILNCPNKAKISAITDTSNVDDIKNIDQEKK